MKLEPFKMERMQSTWENIVKYNLSESGVHPMKLNELLDGDVNIEDLLNTGIGYVQSNGTEELRELISSFYPGTSIENVIVTNGSAEANFITIWSMIDRGDELILMLPNYMQIWGISRCFGGIVKPFYLKEELGWNPDYDELKKMVTERTKMIAICNPNNPTGNIIDEKGIEKICEIADKAGTWILSDEVYQGSELNGVTTSSLWGKYDRLFVVNGLSKAYGLPGLRIGWVIGNKKMIGKLWGYKDYVTISPGILSDYLARFALKPEKREKIFERTRKILNTNIKFLDEWIENHKENFSYIKPEAGAIAYIKYNMDINSTVLVEKLRKEKSVLIVPGDHFGMDKYLRIGYGPEKEVFITGMNLLDELLNELD
ncbi:hypothetical protein DRQ09_01540 [candidate division KSB1 bacterium]|nr:MAG: hypothetical protein DRQ09_01540 [candidate division KSB1 bacterium]